ncbi:tryptophan synthase subunit alpha [Amycolatopsis benzoatilytica]|uniref:tryptophan synthase subunit alpha n=1 Tax=Amycolatopsis benzoatilytica TaxID=346045 RepID=UPI00037C51F2|nr:tryptophan synthase subunit alpha [Amycolatopsis benzoatilytica]
MNNRKILMPYVTGGVTPQWTDHLAAMAAAGADWIEVGIPFSDPTLDGVTIQEASTAALANGATPRSVLDGLKAATVPVVVSTYANLALREGFCAQLKEAGATGLIVPDLPLDEAPALEEEVADAGIELALLVSPATPPDRAREIAARSRGFVYAVSSMSTTGERDHLPQSALDLADRIEADCPVLIGFGISRPEHAAAAARVADGVIVGAAIMRRVLDGEAPAQVGEYVETLRAALDA